jgi:malate dehydrogenase (oxaloacetate-decarboxylating)
MPSKEELLARAKQPSQDALRLHPFYQGKIQVVPKCPVRSFADFSIWYTPGVASACKAIQAHPELSYEHSNRANTIAIVSDGTRVLGLGDIGPEAGMPVMEGKALLFKYLGGVDAIPLCLGTKDPDELIRTVQILEPSFGGVNLEDISQPKCFRVLEQLRSMMHIPVWHDDQQGTATVTVAALLSALKVVGKELHHVRIALIGIGAANVAVYRLLLASGVNAAAIVACDRNGTLHRGRGDIERVQHEYFNKWHICSDSNGEHVIGGVADALRGSDVCISFAASGPDVIRPEWIRTMASDAIVFACANPVPEIWPWDAKDAGARIVATGRGDFPNQVNNSLVFPGIFRGALDVRATTITDEMALAAARELTLATEPRLNADRIVPRMDEWEIYPRIAAATGMQAQAQLVAKLQMSREQLLNQATRIIRNARETTHALMREGLIAPVPETHVSQ